MSETVTDAIERAQDQMKFFANFRAARETEFFNRIGQKWSFDG
jgi:hypothetical protein